MDADDPPLHFASPRLGGTCARRDCHNLFFPNPRSKKSTRFCRDTCAMAQWRLDHLDRERVYRSNTRSHKYGLKKPQYDALYAFQDARCGACGDGFDKAPFIDHDHDCCPRQNKSCGACIRGLLCSFCNTAAGYLKDDPKRAKRLAAYLESPPFRRLATDLDWSSGGFRRSAETHKEAG